MSKRASKIKKDTHVKEVSHGIKSFFVSKRLEVKADQNDLILESVGKNRHHALPTEKELCFESPPEKNCKDFKEQENLTDASEIIVETNISVPKDTCMSDAKCAIYPLFSISSQKIQKIVAKEDIDLFDDKPQSIQIDERNLLVEDTELPTIKETVIKRRGRKKKHQDHIDSGSSIIFDERPTRSILNSTEPVNCDETVIIVTDAVVDSGEKQFKQPDDTSEYEYLHTDSKFHVLSIGRRSSARLLQRQIEDSKNVAKEKPIISKPNKLYKSRKVIQSKPATPSWFIVAAKDGRSQDVNDSNSDSDGVVSVSAENSSVDYIGYIFYVGFKWKSILKKFRFDKVSEFPEMNYRYVCILRKTKLIQYDSLNTGSDYDSCRNKPQQNFVI
jgi:hypothetical protein